MSQPHKVSLLPAIIRDAWWFIRGVEGDYYRRICARCGQTGQAHWAPFNPMDWWFVRNARRIFGPTMTDELVLSCIRFKPKPEEARSWMKKVGTPT